MPDENAEGNDKQDSDEYGGDPEVPLIHAARIASHDTNNSEVKKERADAYTDHTFETMRISLIWLWEHKPGAQGWSAIAALLAAFAALALVLYSNRQWKFMSDQVYLTGESEKVNRMAQWPHADIPQQLQIRTITENGKVTAWIPEITMVNGGNTGTYNAVEIVSTYASPLPAPETCDFPDNGKPQHSDIGPHESELFDTQPIPVAEIKSINSGGHVYIFGSVEYRDVFEFYGLIKHGRTHHLREFCYELRLDSTKGDIASPNYVPKASLVVYGSRNCTDGGCDDYCRKTHQHC
jgi:hypothetical protein